MQLSSRLLRLCAKAPPLSSSSWRLLVFVLQACLRPSAVAQRQHRFVKVYPYHNCSYPVQGWLWDLELRHGIGISDSSEGPVLLFVLAVNSPRPFQSIYPMRSLHSPFASEGGAVFLRPRAAFIEQVDVIGVSSSFKMLLLRLVLLRLLLSSVSGVIDSSASSGEQYSIVSRKDSRITLLLLSQHISLQKGAIA